MWMIGDAPTIEQRIDALEAKAVGERLRALEAIARADKIAAHIAAERLDVLESTVAKLRGQVMRVSFWDVLSKQRAVNEALLAYIATSDPLRFGALADALREAMK